MIPPPRDSDGSVLPHDHDEIKDEDEVIRRISDYFISQNPDGSFRISSMAYRASTGKNGGMSVDLKQLIEKDGKKPDEYVTTPRWMGSLLFKVSDLRGLEFQVGYDPITGPEPNPYHGEVWGKFSNSKIQQLKNIAEWFVPIPDVNIL